MGRLLSFNDRVSLAVGIVNEYYPKAQFYAADGISSTGSTTNTFNIDQIRVTFNNPDGTTVVIKESRFGKFSHPLLKNDQVYIAHTSSWPIPISLDRANTLKEKAGYSGAYERVTLKTPLLPGCYNPFYIFGQDADSFVFVDAISGEVHAKSDNFMNRFAFFN